MRIHQTLVIAGLLLFSACGNKQSEEPYWYGSGEEVEELYESSASEEALSDTYGVTGQLPNGSDNYAALSMIDQIDNNLQQMRVAIATHDAELYSQNYAECMSRMKQLKGNPQPLSKEHQPACQEDLKCKDVKSQKQAERPMRAAEERKKSEEKRRAAEKEKKAEEKKSDAWNGIDPSLAKESATNASGSAKFDRWEVWIGDRKLENPSSVEIPVQTRFKIVAKDSRSGKKIPVKWDWTGGVLVHTGGVAANRSNHSEVEFSITGNGNIQIMGPGYAKSIPVKVKQ